MAKRVALTALLPSTSAALEHPIHQPDEAASEPPAVEQEEAGTAAVSPERRLTTTPPSQRPSTKPHAVPRSDEPTHQHYSELLRKETRLREDQIDGLAQHARRLSRSKTATTERITDNTLIRIAVDLLLRDPDRLRGNTEHELRKSVGL